MDNTVKLHSTELVRCHKRQCLVALHAQNLLLADYLSVAIVVNVVGRSPILTAEQFEMVDPGHFLHYRGQCQ